MADLDASRIIDRTRAPHPKPCPDCGREHMQGEHVAMSTPDGRRVWEGCMDCWKARSRAGDLLAEVERLRDVEEAAVQWKDRAQRHYAEVERLRDGLRKIATARCLGNLPPGCAGTCVTCQARALLDDHACDNCDGVDPVLCANR